MSLMEVDDVITRVERRRVSHPAAQTSLVNSTHTSRGGVKLGSHKTYMGALFFDPIVGIPMKEIRCAVVWGYFLDYCMYKVYLQMAQIVFKFCLVYK